jgi:hypothetical protein
MMTVRKRPKQHSDITPKELAKATAKFDRELIIDESTEPTAQQKAQWQRAKRKRGRPKIGKGVRLISVSIEQGLLERTDQLARRLKVQRTKLIARGLEAILNKEVAVD